MIIRRYHIRRPTDQTALARPLYGKRNGGGTSLDPKEGAELLLAIYLFIGCCFHATIKHFIERAAAHYLDKN